jgi:hypothetical protein
MSDFLFGGMGSITQRIANDGLNALYGLSVIEESGGKVKENPKLFYTYDPTDFGKPDFSSWGMYGILPSQLHDLWESMSIPLTGETDYYAKGGVSGKSLPVKKEVTPEERMAHTTAFIVDALAIIGLSDADLSAINNKFQSILKKKMQERYGGETNMKIIKGASGSSKKGKTSSFKNINWKNISLGKGL